MKSYQVGNYKAYVWKGLNRWHQKAKGIVVAQNKVAALEEVVKLGIESPTVQTASVWMLPGKVTKKIKTTDIVYLMRQLSTLIKSGIPLVQSLEIISNGSEKIPMRAMTLSIRDELVEGKTLSQAITHYSKYFNSLICGLIASGEQSGTLDNIVNEIANYLEHQEYLKSRIRRAMYYPLTIMSVAILVCLAMLLFLVPRFETVYIGFKAKLPAYTQAFVDASHFLRTKWYVFILFVIGFIFIMRFLIKKITAFRYFLSRLSIHVFLFGTLMQKAIISRICMTLSITLGAGVPLIEALNRVQAVANNLVYADAIAKVREDVSQGKSISLSLRSTQLFPPMVTQMIEVGEKSGALDHMLAKVAEYYREQVNTAVEGLTTLIEPLLIVVLGVIIGLFVVAMYLPIFNLGMVLK